MKDSEGQARSEQASKLTNKIVDMIKQECGSDAGMALVVLAGTSASLLNAVEDATGRDVIAMFHRDVRYVRDLLRRDDASRGALN